MTTEFAAEIPFDQYARYRDLLHAVGFLFDDTGTVKEPPADFSILDIGGLFHPLSGDPYLPIRLFFKGCTAVAIDRTVPRTSLPMMARADGTSLPFRDRSYQWINASDVIEHVPVDRRLDLIREMLRCSRGYISLSAPVGTPDVNLAEEFVLAYLRRVLHIDHQALSEHRTMTLPAEHDIRRMINEIDPSLQCAILPSGNLYRWIFMMISRHLALVTGPPQGVNAEIDRLYNLHCYASDHRRPVYRNLYVIGHDRRINELEDFFVHQLFPDATEWAHDNDILLMDLLSRIEDQERWLRFLDMQERIVTLNREVTEAREETARLQRELHAISQIWTVRLWQRLKGLI